MKILVLGCKGQLGRCLNDQLVRTNYEVIYTSREQIDISDFDRTKNKILDIYPDAVINATAYTAVDKAEEYQETANLINHLAVANIANICEQIGCWLIHISTDYVFDGNSKTPYKEDAKTNPQGIYGKTKLMGELAIQAIGCKYMIIRTAWVFSEYGNNFLKTILRLAEERSELNIIGDQIGCPTYAQDIAKSIVIIMGMLKSKNNIQGIYNFVNDFGCSWADFADDILNEAIKQNIIENKPKINKIRTSDFPTLAKRPKQSQLDFSKFEKTFGINQSNYVDGISSALLAYKNLKFK